MPAGTWVRHLDLPCGQSQLALRVSGTLRAQNRKRIWPRNCYCLVVSGIGRYSDSDGTRALSPGDVFLHPRDREHQIEREASHRWCEWSLRMDVELEEHLEQLGITRSDVVVRPGALEERQDAFRRLQAALTANTPDTRVLLELQRYLLAIGPGEIRPDPLDHAATMLGCNFNENFEVEHIAEELGYSVVHFRRLFKARHGLSPRMWRARARLERAKELLADEGLSVQATAMTLGYTTPFAFSRHFSKQTGVAPSAWRQKTSEGSDTSVFVRRTFDD